MVDEDCTLPTHTSFDFLIISKNSLKKKLSEKINANCIILDGSNSKRFVTYLAEQMENRRVPAHSVLQEGAYIF